MWMMFPKGLERISVERQTFEVEARDAEGNCYTRVPNHFVPILTHHLKFHVADPPEGAPDDLPMPDPLRDGAIAELSKENEVLRRDTEGLRIDLNALRAELTAVTHERDELKAKLDKCEDRVSKLEEEKEDVA